VAEDVEGGSGAGGSGGGDVDGDDFPGRLGQVGEEAGVVAGRAPISRARCPGWTSSWSSVGATIVGADTELRKHRRAGGGDERPVRVGDMAEVIGHL